MVQSYANHRRLPWFYFACGLALLASACYLLQAAIRQPGCAAWMGALSGCAVVVVWHRARRAAQVVQDRVIRLEMRLRLHELGRGPAFARLSTPQLVALRFAGDGELPALVDRVLAGELAAPDAIKRAVRDWQPDLARA